ncbi:MAG: extracellular solute-binding protein [Candidatus Paceibacteria bacterium]
MTLSPRQVKILIIVALVGVFLFVAIFTGFRPQKSQIPRLVFWSPYEEPVVFEDLITRYTQENEVKIEYVLKNPATYEQELIDSLAAGVGPDIFVINNSWLPKHGNKLYPAPPDIISSRDVQEIYPEVVFRDFVAGDRVYALPLSVDTLALFYNQSLLDQVGIVFPPKTWEELVVDVPKLTKINQAGLIERSAISLGTSNNVLHAADILSLLMMQLGSNMSDPEKLEVTFQKSTGLQSIGGEALQFYTRFAQAKEKLYTWNRDLPNSQDAFSRGELAMFLGYARDIKTVRQKAPYLDFRITQAPIVAAMSGRVDYANYWGYAVSRTSRYPKEAWKFIGWLNELNQARTYMRKANLPPARRELIREVMDEPILGVFARQALTAKSWYQPDPEAVNLIFKSMIDDVNFGRFTPEEAVKHAANQINLLFKKYSQ